MGETRQRTASESVVKEENGIRTAYCKQARLQALREVLGLIELRMFNVKDIGIYSMLNLLNADNFREEIDEMIANG